MSTAYFHCPVGGACAHSEAFDPTHETELPELASADLAADRLVEHMRAVHHVPRNEVGALVSQARMDTSKPAPSVRLLRDMWRAGDAR